MATPTVPNRDLTADRARSQSRRVPLLTWHPLVQQWAIDELARGHGNESTRTYGVQINAFVKWLSITLDSGPNAITHDVAWRYLYERERTPDSSGHYRSPRTLKFSLRGINRFGQWLKAQKLAPGWVNLSWSRFYGGPGSHPPVPAIEFNSRTPLSSHITADMPITAILARYIADNELNGLPARTAKEYGVHLELFLEFCADWHEHSPGEITRDDVWSWIQSLINTPKRGGGSRSPNTVKRSFTRIKNWCKWAEAVRLLHENPTLGLKGPKGRTVLPQPPPDEVVVHAMRVAFQGRTCRTSSRMGHISGLN